MLTFELKLKEVEVQVVTTTGTQSYTLRELTGLLRDTYWEAMAAKMVEGADGKRYLPSASGLHAKLVSLSLYDAQGKAVEHAVIQSWPASVVTALAKAASELSGLNAKVGEQEAGAKKD